MTKLDPWGSVQIKSYEKLMKEFGIQPFKDVLSKIDNPHPYMKRGIIYGHREFGRIAEAIKKGKRYAMMTGFMPSGKAHLGHRMLMDQIVWYQNKGALTYVCIADIEAYTVRRISRKDCLKFGMDYLAYLAAMGLDATKAVLYFQSGKDGKYHAFSKLAARKVTFNELEAIYGELSPGKIVSALTQVADILLPQLEHGTMPTVVPVGSDQDPHMRLTRDIAARFKAEYGFALPSSTYHKFQTGLDGGKMSSSKPSSYIALNEDESSIKKKVMNAFTGGRATLEEQKKLGGKPEICTIFELFAYHVEMDDKALREIYEACKAGKRMCGPCKKECAEKLVVMLKELNEKKEVAREKIKELVEVPKVHGA